MCCSAVFIWLCSLTSPECLSLWIQHWNFLVICLALTYNGTLLFIRELLLEPYIILNGFLAWWRIYFGRVLTPAFIPSLLLDEGHSLYLQNDFPFFSFIPAFLLSSTPGHESENLTPRKEEERRAKREGRQIERERRSDGDIWEEERRVDRYLRETSNLRRHGLALLPWGTRHCIKKGS